jgi:hypothetical protein
MTGTAVVTGGWPGLYASAWDRAPVRASHRSPVGTKLDEWLAAMNITALSPGQDGVMRVTDWDF